MTPEEDAFYTKCQWYEEIKTEHLARLHATIQAIDYERENDEE